MAKRKNSYVLSRPAIRDTEEGREAWIFCWFLLVVVGQPKRVSAKIPMYADNANPLKPVFVIMAFPFIGISSTEILPASLLRS
jgi:hypothetical protein